MMTMPVQLDVRLWACMRVWLIEGGVFSHACFYRSGWAPIHSAARGGHSSTVELLIARNADVNARNKWVLLMMMTPVFSERVWRLCVRCFKFDVCWIFWWVFALFLFLYLYSRSHICSQWRKLCFAVCRRSQHYRCASCCWCMWRVTRGWWGSGPWAGRRVRRGWLILSWFCWTLVCLRVPSNLFVAIFFCLYRPTKVFICEFLIISE